MATLSQEVEVGSTTTVDSLEEQTIDEQQETILYNGVPHFKEGYKFGNYEVIERVGWDESVGASYFVVDSSKQFELVLRFDRIDEKNSILPLEKMVLTEADKEGKHRFFGQIHDSGYWLDDPAYAYYILYYRGGPSLRQITDFMISNRSTGAKFSASTTGRFAENLFEIVGFLHSKNLILCGMNKDMFHFDGSSRTLFLSDLSSIRCEPTKDLSHLAKWAGSLDYMPVNWTNPEMIKRNMEIESVFYMTLEFARGSLDWTPEGYQSQLERKKLFEESDVPAELKELPEAYHKLWALTKEISKSDKPYESLDPIRNQCIVIYKEVGGCLDLDDDLDFERQPTEEELPRFVLEKKPTSEDQPTSKDQPMSEDQPASEDQPTSEDRLAE